MAAQWCWTGLLLDCWTAAGIAADRRGGVQTVQKNDESAIKRIDGGAKVTNRPVRVFVLSPDQTLSILEFFRLESREDVDGSGCPRSHDGNAAGPGRLCNVSFLIAEGFFFYSDKFEFRS